MDDPSTTPAVSGEAQTEPLSPSEDNWTLVEGPTETTTPQSVKPGEQSSDTKTSSEGSEEEPGKSEEATEKVEEEPGSDKKSEESGAATALQKHWKGKKARESYKAMKSLSSSELPTSPEKKDEPTTTTQPKPEELPPITTTPTSTTEDKKEEKQKEKEQKEKEEKAALKKLEDEKEKKLRDEKQKLEEEKRIKVSSEKEVKGSKSTESQIELKFILIGDAGVGKTNLLSRFMIDEYKMSTTSTISIESARKSILMADGQKIRVSIWDTAGQERYRAIARSFYKGLNAIFIVYDCADPHSLTSVSDWYEEVRQHCDTNPEMILIGNKIDLAVECSHFVSEEDALVVANEQKMLLFNTSAKTGDNCQRVFNKTVELCYDKILKGEVARVVAEVPKPKEKGCC